MNTMMILRHFHVGRIMWTPTVEKSALAKLRKSTGYSFSKCKEALQKHENDVKEAEIWLKAQAQVHGWEKATKLKGRTTAQGLISVFISNSNAVMVETNCETDFVARNKKFQSLVQKVTQGVFNYSSEQPVQTGNNLLLSTITLSHEQLANLPLTEARAVKDETAVFIGELGENIQNRRAICFNAQTPVLLAGYTHPLSESNKELQCGKYGVIVAYRPVGEQQTSKQTLDQVSRQLCQHIVGMNPTEIGTLNPKPVAEETTTVEEEQPNVDKENPSEEKRSDEDDEDESARNIQYYPDSDETTLLNQDFLLDPDLSVGEFLLENGVEVLDFVRFEVGESKEISQHG